VEDAGAWILLWERSARAAFTPLLPPGSPFPEAREEVVRDHLADPARSLLVADDDGDLTGLTTSGASRDPGAPGSVGEIHMLFVAPERWKEGIGRELLSAGLADLRERGCTEVTVWSFAANERANAFYAAQGFEPDGGQRTEDVWAHLLQLRYRRALD
jgi:GNAT superfamily N-acetyltransferase